MHLSKVFHKSLKVYQLLKLFRKRERHNQQQSENVVNIHNHEAEKMFTKGAAACGISFTFFSILTTISVVLGGLVANKILTSMSDKVKNLYIDLAMETICIFISLNMSVAFLTFSIQSPAFRWALIDDEYKKYFFKPTRRKLK